MKRTLEELEAIVRRRICGVCTDRNEDGTCGLEERANCALFRLFPLVARAIQATQSHDIQDYIDAIRKEVCSVCAQGEPGGSCEVRNEVRCALDAYMVLVVETIEEATGVSFESPGSKPTNKNFPAASNWVRNDWKVS
jgi:hypothetical protein